MPRVGVKDEACKGNRTVTQCIRIHRRLEGRIIARLSNRAREPQMPGVITLLHDGRGSVKRHDERKEHDNERNTEVQEGYSPIAKVLAMSISLRCERVGTPLCQRPRSEIYRPSKNKRPKGEAEPGSTSHDAGQNAKHKVRGESQWRSDQNGIESSHPQCRGEQGSRKIENRDPEKNRKEKHWPRRRHRYHL